jgi:hypothetical protein
VSTPSRDELVTAGMLAVLVDCAAFCASGETWPVYRQWHSQRRRDHGLEAPGDDDHAEMVRTAMASMTEYVECVKKMAVP